MCLNPPQIQREGRFLSFLCSISFPLHVKLKVLVGVQECKPGDSMAAEEIMGCEEGKNLTS